MARWPDAIWEPGAPHGGPLDPIAVTLHHQAGWGDPLGTYLSNSVSAHFWIPIEGQPMQHVDTAQEAWHGVAHNAYSIGVETEGCGSPPHADPLTESQLDWFGALMAWAHEEHGIPLVLSESVWTPGLNYHRCQGGPPTGCPCDVRVNARVEILRRAQGGQAPTSEGGDDVFIRSSDGRVRWFIADGQKSYWRPVPEGCEQDITDRIIDDPNDSWLNLWDH
jgi:hypothetical protein